MLRTIATKQTRQVSTAFSTVLKRGKATQADLPYDFNALEPYISAEIMDIHYNKHHKTYINNYNVASEKLQEALHTNDIKAQNALLPAINFNSGGHINHTLFWSNLAPVGSGGGEAPTPGSNFANAIDAGFGSLDHLVEVANGKLAAIQGSGWTWVVKNKVTGAVEIVNTANQDTVPANYVPLVGIDAWEHAYYLQYKNVKVDYFKNIWNVINWAEAAKRFE